MMPHIRTELWIVDLLCSIICDTAGQARHGAAGLGRRGEARLGEARLGKENLWGGKNPPYDQTKQGEKHDRKTFRYST